MSVCLLTKFGGTGFEFGNVTIMHEISAYLHHYPH